MPTVSFDTEGEVRAFRKELGEHEVMIAKHARRIADLEHESKNHRDRDIQMMGILRAVGESLDANTKSSHTMKKQINKLFALMKERTHAGQSKPKP